MGTKAVKYSEHKPRWHLIPWRPMQEVVRVMEAGLHEGTDKERTEGDWKNGTDWCEYSDAAFRHLIAWQDGQDNDDETCRSHLGHVICCCLILMWYQIRGVGRDNR